MDTQNCHYLTKKAGLKHPVIGLYDTSEPEEFQPLVEPGKGKWACVFMFFNEWNKGKSLRLTKENYGCGGAGTYLFGEKTRSKKDYINFLYGEEGLKASEKLMAQ